MAMSRYQVADGATDAPLARREASFSSPGTVAQGERRLGLGGKVSLRDCVNERERCRRAIGLALLEIAGLAHLVGHMREAKHSLLSCFRKGVEGGRLHLDSQNPFCSRRIDRLESLPIGRIRRPGRPALYRLTDVDERSFGNHQQTRICLRVLGIRKEGSDSSCPRHAAPARSR